MMEFPRPSMSAGDLLGGLKDRFSRGQNREEEPYEPYEPYEDDYYEDDEFVPEGDYGPYSYNPETDDAFVERGLHDKLAAADNQHQGVRYPRLVTSEEIKASASSLGYAARNAAKNAASDTPRVMVDQFDARDYERPMTDYADFVSPYQSQQSQQSQPEPAAPAQVDHNAMTQVLETVREPHAASTGSAGLDGLFMPTTPAAKVAAASRRSLRVVKPMSYQDVEAVAAAVKAGDVAVLYLRLTEENLTKRVLDFSFGVAAALDANVDCIAEQVFVVAKGAGLTLDEKHQLRQQGVL